MFVTPHYSDHTYYHFMTPLIETHFQKRHKMETDPTSYTK